MFLVDDVVAAVALGGMGLFAVGTSCIVSHRNDVRTRRYCDGQIDDCRELIMEANSKQAKDREQLVKFEAAMAELAPKFKAVEKDVTELKIQQNQFDAAAGELVPQFRAVEKEVAELKVHKDQFEAAVTKVEALAAEVAKNATAVTEQVAKLATMEGDIKVLKEQADKAEDKLDSVQTSNVRIEAFMKKVTKQLADMAAPATP